MYGRLTHEGRIDSGGGIDKWTERTGPGHAHRAVGKRTRQSFIFISRYERGIGYETFISNHFCVCDRGLLLATAPVFAQETSSSIVGTVVDATGAPLPGVQVDAEGPLGKLTAVTDADGQYLSLIHISEPTRPSP